MKAILAVLFCLCLVSIACAGAVGGPQEGTGGGDGSIVEFEGGQPAAIAVGANAINAAGHIRVEVFDATGTLVAKDKGDFVALVVWLPKVRAKYTIKVSEGAQRGNFWKSN